MANTSSIIACFDEIVSQRPDGTALLWDDGAWTYAELNARANRLAHALIDFGIEAEDPVGVFALRSPETLVALLAILKAGGAYVPLDPAYPPERNRFCLEDAGIELVLIDANEKAKLPATSAKVMTLQSISEGERPSTNPPKVPGPDSLAYILYTSGSTGQPKGVLIEHRGVVRVARDPDYAQVTPKEIFLQYAPLHFDASTFEIWAAWLNGATLAVPAPGLNSLRALGSALRSFRVSTLWLTAGHFNLMVEQEIEALAGVGQLLTGGEVVSPAHAELFLKKFPRARLINGYGPTENTVFTACHRIELEHPMPVRISIGRPIRDTGVLIMNERLEAVPAGESGELIMTGDGLARGYLNRPELTAQSFIEVTGPSGKKVRAYRSGDLGRYQPDGSIDFLGRLDQQVKINGLRIEPGEIQNVLQAHREVAGAEIVVVEVLGKKRLEAFVVLRPGSGLAEMALREFLAQKLPVNWLPASIHIVDSLPLTPNGKVDRRALVEKAQAFLRLDNPQPGGAPNDFLEKAVLNIWREILPGRSIGRQDNFFDLGGDSLLAMNMIAQVEKITGPYVALRPFLENATILSIVSAARATGKVERPPLLTCTQAGTSKPPFFFAHGDYTAGGFFCQKMARSLGVDQPFYSLRPPGTYGRKMPSSIEQMAEIYLELIQGIQPKGPYYLGGFCNGGLAMYEVAQRLLQAGEEVRTFVVVYPPYLFLPALSAAVRGALGKAGVSEVKSMAVFGRIAEYISVCKERGFLSMLAYGGTRFLRSNARRVSNEEATLENSPAPNINLHYLGLVTSYRPMAHLEGVPVLILLGNGEDDPCTEQVHFWRRHLPHARLEVVAGSHSGWRNSLGEMAEKIKAELARAMPVPAAEIGREEFPTAIENSRY